MNRNLLIPRVYLLFFILITLPILFTVQVHAQSSTANTTGFITKWEIAAANQGITIPIDPNQVNNYHYSVDWGDNTSDVNLTGSAYHTYLTAGTYNVKITGEFPAIKFANPISDQNNDASLIAVTQWGNGTWAGMDGAFYGCKNLVSVPNGNGPVFAANATLFCMFKDCAAFNGDLDQWDLSHVRETANMFDGASSFNGNISTWDVSNVTNMQNMFNQATLFNGDISSWDVSSVELMQNMFNNAEAFNGAIGSWDVSQVTNMFAMFYNANGFNQNIGGWDVSNVTDMNEMFYGATSFNQDLNNWDVSKVTNMSSIFEYGFAFNGNIASWDVSNVENMDHMFYHASAFNQYIGSWNVSKVINMQEMFHYAESFDQNIGSWNVAQVTNMYAMFRGGRFNQPLNTWDVSSVKNMRYMFAEDSLFNQDIGNWDVSAVEDMSDMFENAVGFNQDLKGWDVSSVEDMSYMFHSATNFNGDISTWNVSKVKSMELMFAKAVSFNSPIGSWNVSAVITMHGMFKNVPVFNQDISGWTTTSLMDISDMFYNAAAFNQDISGWDVSHLSQLDNVFFGDLAFDQNLGAWDISNVTSMVRLFNATAMSAENYEATLNGWATQSVQTGVVVGVDGLRFCDNTGHAVLVNNNDWHFLGDRNVCFVAAVPDGNGVVYVDSSVAVAGDGSSWKRALQYLSNATQSANLNTSIKEIHIAKGTYFPTGKRNAVYRDSCFNVTRSGLKLLGGYPNGGGDRNIMANQTLLSGDIGVAGDSVDNAYNIMRISNIAASDSLLVDGLTFTRGAAFFDRNQQGGEQNIGGGLTIIQAFSNTVINHCTFFENYGYYCPALAVFGADPTGNEQDIIKSNPQILHCQFISNKVVISDNYVTYAGIFVSALSDPL